MKTIITTTAVVSAFLFTALLPKHSEVYKVDTKDSSLEWFAEKVTGKHNGTINLSSGSIINNHGILSATFEIDMNTIVCTDLSGESKTKLENHLKSDDFFSSAKYPKAKFVSTSITPITDPKNGFTHTVKGNLTIKEKTNEISFDATIKMEGNKIVCNGTAIVDRSKFDVRYGSKSFFPEIGNRMIYDEFKVKFNVIAVK